MKKEEEEEYKNIWFPVGRLWDKDIEKLRKKQKNKKKSKTKQNQE